MAKAMSFGGGSQKASTQPTMRFRDQGEAIPFTGTSVPDPDGVGPDSLDELPYGASLGDTTTYQDVETDEHGNTINIEKVNKAGS